MRKLLSIALLLVAVTAKSQLLTWSPAFIKESSTPDTIFLDANYGNKALLNYTPPTDVYVHIGVITSKSTSGADWKYVKFTWGSTTTAAQCTYLGSNKWRYIITGGLRSFFNITDASETVKKIAILFRNGTGSVVQRNADGSDMYVPVYDNGVYARIDVPYKQPLYVPKPEPIVKNIGDPLTITAKSSVAGTLKILFNGVQLGSTSATSLTVNTTITAGDVQQIIAEATSGSTNRDTLTFLVPKANTVADLPAGTVDGINYEAGDTSAVLVLYAPYKKNIIVIGDFNNWAQSTKYQMNITPDGNRYWLRITGLTPGTEYAYQYVIDGTLTVADYNCEKILDPYNDPYISSSTYPNLKPYPTGKTSGNVSILQTKKPVYQWQVPSFKRPNKQALVIYELLVRDFVAAQNWQTLKDTLTYLKRLGVNAIELMPFNEFDGNNSWGYNPAFYLAPDKAYGTETALKQFIDQCHLNGIAVIMDIAMNHSCGSSPQVQMYWDAANGRPASNNPWFNTVAKHAFNVCYDMNHESTATNDFVNRVINHWLKNYKIDGFRWDLSKGFTQKQTCDNNGGNCDVNAWTAYDASRIAIWKKYYGYMQTASSGSYCILEHLGANDEEKELSDNGMMLWGNMNYNYNQSTMGYSSGWDLSWGVYNARGWSQPNLITYMESHDEERLQYKNELYGNISGNYNVKTLSTGLARDGMAAAILLMQPGPKMIWQFGELGYDTTINACNDGTAPKEACRTNPKPIKWNYYSDVNRKALYDVYSKLCKLRTYPNYVTTFTTGGINYNLTGSIKWFNTSSDSLKVMVYGNFDVVAKSGSITFPATGVWYSYLTGTQTEVDNVNLTVTLQPGEYYVYTNKKIDYAVLPVNWLSFTANKTDKKTVELKWTVADEFDNDRYEIERSSSGSSFASIAAVAPKTHSGKQDYTFTDVLPLSGTSYYRIRQVDKNGKYSLSAIVKITFDGGNVSWQVFPNPARNNAMLQAQTNLTKVQVQLTDLSGKTVYRQAYSSINAGQQIKIPVENLKQGMYMLQVSSEQGIRTEKLFVN